MPFGLHAFTSLVSPTKGRTIGGQKRDKNKARAARAARRRNRKR